MTECRSKAYIISGQNRVHPGTGIPAGGTADTGQPYFSKSGAVKGTAIVPQKAGRSAGGTGISAVF